MPWFLQVAIEHGLTVLSWHENLPSDEVPPQHLWEDSEGLDQWWERVKSRRDYRSSGGRAPDPGEEELVENELARELKR